MEEKKQQPMKKGPCCVCKETKSARDTCFLLKSEEECTTEVNLHIQCLIKEGYDPQK